MKWEFAVLTVLISVRLNDSAPSLGTDYRVRVRVRVRRVRGAGGGRWSL